MYITQVYDESGQAICDLNWHSVDTETGFKTDRKENAQLIAMAPDMYYEIQRDIDRINSILKIQSGLRNVPLIAERSRKVALLAKARGE